MQLTIRRGKPSDAEHTAPLIYSSGPDVFDYLFGVDSKSPLPFIASSFRRTYGFLSYKSHIIATNELGTPIGTCSAYGYWTHKRLSLGMIVAIFRFYNLKSSLKVLGRCLKLEASRKPPTRRQIYICNYGVSQTARQQGVATALFTGLQRMYGKHARDGFILDVATSNDAAIGLYHKLGFRGHQVAAPPSSNVKPVKRLTLSRKGTM